MQMQGIYEYDRIRTHRFNGITIPLIKKEWMKEKKTNYIGEGNLASY